MRRGSQYRPMFGARREMVYPVVVRQPGAPWLYFGQWLGVVLRGPAMAYAFAPAVIIPA